MTADDEVEELDSPIEPSAKGKGKASLKFKNTFDSSQSIQGGIILHPSSPATSQSTYSFAFDLQSPGFSRHTKRPLLPGAKMAVSFRTPNVEREYILALSVHIEGFDEFFVARVPIQILPGDGNEEAERTEEEQETPVYVYEEAADREGSNEGGGQGDGEEFGLEDDEREFFGRGASFSLPRRATEREGGEELPGYVKHQ